MTLQDRRLVRACLSKGVEGIDRLVTSILPHHILKDGRLVFSCSNQHMEAICPEIRQWQLENRRAQMKCSGSCAASGRALYDWSFQSRLDGEDYRRLVMTSGGFLINTVNMTVKPANKDVVITKSLGIPYPATLCSPGRA